MDGAALLKLTAVVMLVCLRFDSGLQVNRERLIAPLTNTWLLARAFIANFVIVPLVGVLLAKSFQLPPTIATGFLLTAIPPGVPFVLVSVRKKGGGLGLAVAAGTFPAAPLGRCGPLTAALVLSTQAETALPLGQFVVTLMTFRSCSHGGNRRRATVTRHRRSARAAGAVPLFLIRGRLLRAAGSAASARRYGRVRLARDVGGAVPRDLVGCGRLGARRRRPSRRSS